MVFFRKLRHKVAGVAEANFQCNPLDLQIRAPEHLFALLYNETGNKAYVNFALQAII